MKRTYYPVVMKEAVISWASCMICTGILLCKTSTNLFVFFFLVYRQLILTSMRVESSPTQVLVIYYIIYGYGLPKVEVSMEGGCSKGHKSKSVILGRSSSWITCILTHTTKSSGLMEYWIGCK